MTIEHVSSHQRASGSNASENVNRHALEACMWNVRATVAALSSNQVGSTADDVNFLNQTDIMKDTEESKDMSVSEFEEDVSKNKFEEDVSASEFEEDVSKNKFKEDKSVDASVNEFEEDMSKNESEEEQSNEEEIISNLKQMITTIQNSWRIVRFLISVLIFESMLTFTTLFLLSLFHRFQRLRRRHSSNLSRSYLPNQVQSK